jgi:hypothetical protein
MFILVQIIVINKDKTFIIRITIYFSEVLNFSSLILLCFLYCTTRKARYIYTAVCNSDMLSVLLPPRSDSWQLTICVKPMC